MEEFILYLLSVDGEVYGSGNNGSYQLFNTIDHSKHKFELVESGISEIFAGENSSIFIDEDGIPKGRGAHFGETLIEIEGIPFVHNFLISGSSLMILDKEGNVWCKGRITQGQLDIEETTIDVFTIIPDCPTITQISLGPEHLLMVDIDGNLWLSGHNEFGQLGCSEFGEKISKPRKLQNAPFNLKLSSRQKSAKTMIYN